MSLHAEVAMPSGIGVDLEIDPSWPNWFSRHARLIESGVASRGDPASYALVWEWGNLRQYKKGPRTVLGTNPAGQKAWLSSQAAHGWIAINEPQMWDAIDKWMATFHLDGNTEQAISDELERISIKISKDFLALLRGTVPVDTGALDASLEIVRPGDKLLDVIEDSFRDMPEGTTDSGILLIDRSFSGPLNP